MAVVESGVAADSGAVVQPTSQDSDDQNHQSSRIEVGEEEGLYSKMGTHPGRSEGSDGGESYKREMRELQELFSKLNPMAAEFVPPSLSKQPNAAFFPSPGSAFPAAPLEVNAYGHDTGGFRRVRDTKSSSIKFLSFFFCFLKLPIGFVLTMCRRRALVKGNGG